MILLDWNEIGRGRSLKQLSQELSTDFRNSLAGVMNCCFSVAVQMRIVLPKSDVGQWIFLNRKAKADQNFTRIELKMIVDSHE